jgi:hypothetical protein
MDPSQVEKHSTASITGLAKNDVVSGRVADKKS